MHVVTEGLDPFEDGKPRATCSGQEVQVWLESSADGEATWAFTSQGPGKVEVEMPDASGDEASVTDAYWVEYYIGPGSTAVLSRRIA